MSTYRIPTRLTRSQNAQKVDRNIWSYTWHSLTISNLSVILHTDQNLNECLNWCCRLGNGLLAGFNSKLNDLSGKCTSHHNLFWSLWQHLRIRNFFMQPLRINANGATLPVDVVAQVISCLWYLNRSMLASTRLCEHHFPCADHIWVIASNTQVDKWRF